MGRLSPSILVSLNRRFGLWFWLLSMYETFASHYMSFVERDPALGDEPLTLDQIKAYGEANDKAPLVNDVNYITGYLETKHYDLV